MKIKNLLREGDTPEQIAEKKAAVKSLSDKLDAINIPRNSDKFVSFYPSRGSFKYEDNHGNLQIDIDAFMDGNTWTKRKQSDGILKQTTRNLMQLEPHIQVNIYNSATSGSGYSYFKIGDMAAEDKIVKKIQKTISELQQKGIDKKGKRNDNYRKAKRLISKHKDAGIDVSSAEEKFQKHKSKIKKDVGWAFPMDMKYKGIYFNLNYHKTYKVNGLKGLNITKLDDILALIDVIADRKLFK